MATCSRGGAIPTRNFMPHIFEVVENSALRFRVMQLFRFQSAIFASSIYVLGIIVILWIDRTHNAQVTRNQVKAADDCPLCVCPSRPAGVQRAGTEGLDLMIKQLFEPDDTYYDSRYWEFQRPMGEIGGTLEQWKFRDYIKQESNCLDFGAGGGFLLYRLQNCRQKLGVELNPHAVMHARTAFGIELTNDLDKIPNDWADVIFSNHALEHVFCPWCELRRLLPKLKKGTGKLVFVIPAAGRNDEWTGAPDVNFHLYSWSPKTLGNLVTSSGFTDVQVDILAHQWPDNPMSVYETEGEHSFIMKGQQKNRESPYGGCEYQIRVVASRPL